jgi:branched-chain amino acid transport system permease protein
MSAFFETYQYTVYDGMFLALLGLSAYLLLSTGVLSVAGPAFMAVGAYASGLASIHWGIPFWLAITFGMTLAAIGGAIVALPALRLGALFLTLTTFAVVQIVAVTVTLLTFTGGAGGLTGIPPETTRTWILALFFGACVVLWRLSRSQAYRMMSAIGQSELGAASIGIRIARVRFVVFLLSGALAGMAGALAAHQDLFASPADYGFPLIISMLAALFLGGPAVWYGPILGAAIVVALPEVLRPLADARDYVYGVIFVTVLIWAPQGVAGGLQRISAYARGQWRGRARGGGGGGGDRPVAQASGGSS